MIRLANDKFVAYIDILGFKEMVSKGNTAKFKLQKFHESIYNIWDLMDFSSKDINGLAYSDSLTIFTENDSTNSLECVLNFIKELYDESLFRHKIMLRGGLAKGEFEIYDTIEFKNFIKNQFVGQAFIDAYNLESGEGIKGCRFVFNNSIKEIIDQFNKKGKEYSVKRLEKSNNEIFDFIWIDKKKLCEDNCKRINTFFKLAEKKDWADHYTRTLDLFCLISNINKYDIIKQKITEY